MPQILQAMLQQYIDWELPNVQTGFRKGRGITDQIANIRWVIEKAREFQKNICFTDYAKAFDCVGYRKMWKILQEMGLPGHFTCFLRNPYAGQEAMDWFQIGKGVRQGRILSPCFIMWNAGLDDAQAGIKIARRNINNFRYADDTTLTVEIEEELESLLMKEESEKLA